MSRGSGLWIAWGSLVFLVFFGFLNGFHQCLWGMLRFLWFFLVFPMVLHLHDRGGEIESCGFYSVYSPSWERTGLRGCPHGYPAGLEPRPESHQIKHLGARSVDFWSRCQNSSNRVSWHCFCRLLEPRPESHQIEAPGDGFLALWRQDPKVIKSSLLGFLFRRDS